MQIPKKLIWAAHAEVISLISEGYRRQVTYGSSYTLIIVMRHKSNGNTITVTVTPDCYTLKKNNSIIKRVTF